MKTTIGGDRLGSGNKQEISLRNYERSTHDLSYIWRSSMAPGTLVPFLCREGLPGDSFDIDLNCEVLTLPTIGPLFGSFKVQLDVFQIPMRLYQAELHMNMLGIGMKMSDVKVPQIELKTRIPNNEDAEYDNSNCQISPSSLQAYLGIRGVGWRNNPNPVITFSRQFNAFKTLAYWDVYKNYYANKQEERGFGIHTDNNSISDLMQVIGAELYKDGGIYPDDPGTLVGDLFENNVNTVDTGDIQWRVVVYFGPDAVAPKPEGAGSVTMIVDGGAAQPIWDVMSGLGTPRGYRWVEELKAMEYHGDGPIDPTQTWRIDPQSPQPNEFPEAIPPSVREFPLENIDQMRLDILRHQPEGTPFVIDENSPEPYSWPMDFTGDSVDAVNTVFSVRYGQEQLGLKTYQSDLFNNWIDTEWIEGPNGVNELTAVDTSGGSFTIDALNIMNKVYNMLNRIAISGGSYDDWLDAVYTHKRARTVESPIYMGSLIKELSFQEVVSNADTEVQGNTQPLGTLAGRGRLTNKHKGGSIKIKCDEPCYIMGIASLTPRIDYSQGNNWDVNIKTMDDWHKPALDAIGFQDLITEQMVWSDVDYTMAIDPVFYSAGKQPAWINYMTEVNRTYGNFAIENKEMFMTLNRRYEVNKTTGRIEDLTTYIDPSKFNHIFAQTSLDAQNFWVQIAVKNIARRKMSAKQIPNL